MLGAVCRLSDGVVVTAPLLAVRVEMTPQAKERPRCQCRGGKPRMYTAAKTQAAEARIAMVVRAHMRRNGVAKLDGALVGSVVGVWPRLKKHAKSPEGRLWKETAPDADNLQKIVFDALNKVAYVDDARIVRMTGETVFAAVGEAPGIEVRIWAAPEMP